MTDKPKNQAKQKEEAKIFDSSLEQEIHALSEESLRKKVTNFFDTKEISHTQNSNIITKKIVPYILAALFLIYFFFHPFFAFINPISFVKTYVERQNLIYKLENEERFQIEQSYTLAKEYANLEKNQTSSGNTMLEGIASVRANHIKLYSVLKAIDDITRSVIAENDIIQRISLGPIMFQKDSLQLEFSGIKFFAHIQKEGSPTSALLVAARFIEKLKESTMFDNVTTGDFALKTELTPAGKSESFIPVKVTLVIKPDFISKTSILDIKKTLTGSVLPVTPLK